VAIAEHPCNLPCTVHIFPNRDKLRDAVACFRAELAEPMGALRDRAVVLYGKDLQRTRNDFARESSTGVFFSIGNHAVSAPSHTAVVVIELDIGNEIVCVFLQLSRVATLVKCVEYSRIEGCDGVKQGGTDVLFSVAKAPPQSKRRGAAIILLYPMVSRFSIWFPGCAELFQVGTAN